MTYALKIGQTLDERFKITELIQKGGMASVYEAIDCATGNVVALKVPHLRYESDPAFYSRFQREEEIGKHLRHPSVLRIHSVEGKSRPYIVMERLEGRLLSQRLGEPLPISLSDATEIALQIADALEYMHQRQVIHRDLKPENIMLCDDGSVRVIDLGLARGKAFRQITIAGFSSQMGSPHYMSPEQVKGRRGDERSDIYSLGAILYRMVTGMEPFKGSDLYALMSARVVGDPVAPRKINPRLSPELEEIILHAMARAPRDRYPSVKEMRKELKVPEMVRITDRPARLELPNVWRIRWRRVRVFGWSVLGVLAGTGLLYAMSQAARLRH